MGVLNILENNGANLMQFSEWQLFERSHEQTKLSFEINREAQPPCGKSVVGNVPRFAYFANSSFLNLFHAPRVKSGISTGIDPFFNDTSVRGIRQHHSAKSYTSISRGSPFCKQ